VPDCDQKSQQNGGYFSIRFFVKVGNKDGNMDKLDQIFTSFLLLVFEGGLATEEIHSVVSGIFVRAEIQLGNKNIEDYNNPDDLPAKFCFELWIRDVSMQNIFSKDMNKWTADVVRGEFGFGRETKFAFIKS
jgi:hypothetical protein